MECTEDDVNVSIQALREMRWAFSKNEERIKTLQDIWAYRLCAQQEKKDALLRRKALAHASDSLSKSPSPTGHSPYLLPHTQLPSCGICRTPSRKVSARDISPSLLPSARLLRCYFKTTQLVVPQATPRTSADVPLYRVSQDARVPGLQDPLIDPLLAPDAAGIVPSRCLSSPQPTSLQNRSSVLLGRFPIQQV